MFFLVREFLLGRAFHCSRPVLRPSEYTALYVELRATARRLCVPILSCKDWAVMPEVQRITLYPPLLPAGSWLRLKLLIGCGGDRSSAAFGHLCR